MTCREISYKNGPIVQVFDSNRCPDDPEHPYVSGSGKHAHITGGIASGAIAYTERELKALLKPTGVNRGPAVWLWRNAPACY